MTPQLWFLVAIVVWVVTWAVLETLLARRRLKRDRYADVNEPR